MGDPCRAEKRGALPGGGWRRHCGAPGVGPRRPATRWAAAYGSRVEEAATLRERVTRVGPSTVPNRRPPRGRPLRQVGASHIPCLGRRYSGKNAAYLKRVIAIGSTSYTAPAYFSHTESATQRAKTAARCIYRGGASLQASWPLFSPSPRGGPGAARWATAAPPRPGLGPGQRRRPGGGQEQILSVECPP